MEEEQAEAPRRVTSVGGPTALAMGAVGFAVGFFSGLSDSPVVASVLPLLFATVGGSAGLYFFRSYSATAQYSSRIRVAAVGVSSFAVACVLSAVYGVSLRTGTGLKAFLPTWDPQDSAGTVVSDGGSQEDLSLALLAAKLRLLGVTEADRSLILEKARREISAYPDQNVVTDMRLLREKVNAALEPLQQFMDLLEKKGFRRLDGLHTRDFTMHPAVEELYKELRSTQSLCERWLEADPNGRTLEIPRRTLVGAVTNLKAALEHAHEQPRPATRRPQPRSLEEQGIYDWLPETVTEIDENLELNFHRILDLERSVFALSRAYGAGNWIGNDDDGDRRELADEINAFLDKHAVAGSAEIDPPRTRRRPHIRP